MGARSDHGLCDVGKTIMCRGKEKTTDDFLNHSMMWDCYLLCMLSDLDSSRASLLFGGKGYWHSSCHAVEVSIYPSIACCLLLFSSVGIPSPNTNRYFIMQ